LAKYVGRWVAVRDHEVIADAATAAELLDGLEAARAGAQAGRSPSSPPARRIFRRLTL
jgi:hypothetical protein